MKKPQSVAPGECVTVHLKAGRERSVRNGHPWLFSGAVARTDGPAKAPLARVLAADGKPLGVGFHSARSQIRVRLVGSSNVVVDTAFFAERIRRAAALRHALLPPDTTGYRLINAEGDGLPGWTVDRFGDVLVSQITSAGLEVLRGFAYEALRGWAEEALADEVEDAVAILQLNQLPARRKESLSQKDEWIVGTPRPTAAFTESGLRFTAELEGGQKTGFYCDQRRNRRRVETLAAGRRVLDLFSHTGAVALYALRGGASVVTCVESSPRLLEITRQQLDLNRGQLPEGAALQLHRDDVFEHLRSDTERCDLVVCDPPPLVRRRSNLDAGARAYKDLNRLALRRLAPGGLFLTFSCSGAVDSRLFRQILYSAAVEAGVQLALLEPLSAGEDHPVSVFHPEGEYLKGWLGVVGGGEAEP